VNVSVTTVIRDASCLGGGMLNVARPLHARLQASGREAHFVSGNKAEDDSPASYVVGLNGLGFKALPAAAMRSLVHIHGLWTPFEYRAFKEARRRGATIVMSPHGALESWAFEHKRAKKHIAWRLYQKRLLQSADLLVVNSPQELRRLRELGLTPPIATIPNGVDLEGLSLASAEQNRERIVLFFSRIDPKKGLPDLIEAWRTLADRKGYHLHIHGHGDATYVKMIRNQIAASATGDIALLPPVFGPDRWKVFARASVYVLPSYSENFGITVAEALAAGLPVITTKATPWGNLTREGLGWIVDNDPAQLRGALQAAIGLDSEILSEMRRKGQIYARQRFGWDPITLQYAETYDWATNQSMAAPIWVDRPVLTKCAF